MLSINVSHAKPFLSYPYEEVLCPRLERAQRELLNGAVRATISSAGSACPRSTTARNMRAFSPPRKRSKATPRPLSSSASAAATSARAA